MDNKIKIYKDLTKILGGPPCNYVSLKDDEFYSDYCLRRCPVGSNKNKHYARCWKEFFGGLKKRNGYE